MYSEAREYMRIWLRQQPRVSLTPPSRSSSAHLRHRAAIWSPHENTKAHGSTTARQRTRMSPHFEAQWPMADDETPPLGPCEVHEVQIALQIAREQVPGRGIEIHVRVELQRSSNLPRVAVVRLEHA
jgi:hypothetical protein